MAHPLIEKFSRHSWNLVDGSPRLEPVAELGRKAGELALGLLGVLTLA